MFPASRSLFHIENVFRLVMVFLVLACETASFAQGTLSTDTPNPRKDAAGRFGPFYITPIFELANLGIDTNVFNTPDNPTSDFVIAARPGATVWVPMARRALVTTTAGAGLNYFQESRGERSIDPAVLVRGELYLRRVTLFAQGSYLIARQRPNQEIDARSRRVESRPTAGAAVRLGSRTSVQFSAFSARLRYDQDAVFLGANLSQTLNRDERGVSLGLRERLTSFTTLTLNGESSRDRFEFSPARNSRSLRLAPGFEFNPRALIAGSLEVGVRQFKTDDPTVPDYTGVVASTALTYTLLKTTRFGITWDRDVSYSYQPETPYYVQNSVGGSIRRQIHGRFDGSVGASRSVSVYRSADPSRPGGRDVNVSYSADIGYRMNRNLRAAFAVSTSRRTSDTSAFRAYRGTRAGLSVSYRLPG